MSGIYSAGFGAATELGKVALAGVSGTTGIGVAAGLGATFLATLAIKDIGGRFLEKKNPPPRPLDVSTLSITVNNATALIDYASIRSCCKTFNKVEFTKLEIIDDYKGFLSVYDFIVLCELPISTAIPDNKVDNNLLLLSDKTYRFFDTSYNIVGDRRNTLRYIPDLNIELKKLIPVRGVKSVERICHVLKSSTVDPIQSVVFNSEGIIGNRLLSNSPDTIIVFIKHVLRNMAIVYGDQVGFNLQTTCINIDNSLSTDERFTIPPAPAAAPAAPAAPQLYIFNQKLLSFWKKVTYKEYSSFLHFQVLFNKKFRVHTIDVIFDDLNDFDTLQKVRRDWIRDTFNGDDPKLVKGKIWAELSKEGSSKNSSSLMDYKQEFQKSGSELMDKAIEDYKRAIENGNPESITEMASELRKVETSLYFDAMKSESDTNIRRTLYQELNQISEKGRKFGTDALRRNENYSRRSPDYETDYQQRDGSPFRIFRNHRRGGAVRRGGLKSGKPRKARAKKTKKKRKEKNRLTQRK